ncbi:MAG: hypothetical protein H6867_07800 [Rhodospirillales bacterium]|nr:hypothetical protein [Rhodospirillales bacterium]MCB9995456.1 hypothetical protein [Rhodospirillales bacterium]
MASILSGFKGFMFVLCGVLILTGCTTTVPEGKPLPELTFVHLDRLPVQVARIDIENRYQASADPKDVSSSFPSPPDIALRRYAENRLQAAGGSGVLTFVIDDATIHHSLVQPEGKIANWMGVDRKDRYDVFMRIRMYETGADGFEGTHSVLNFKRTISIPQRYSVADKELEKFKFLEMLMQDVDEAVVATLRDKMHLANIDGSIPMAALLSAPEVR